MCRKINRGEPGSLEPNLQRNNLPPPASASMYSTDSYHATFKRYVLARLLAEWENLGQPSTRAMTRIPKEVSGGQIPR